MLFKNITILDENFDVKEHMNVGVKDGRIAYIGEKEPENAGSYGEVVSGEGKLLMPGFVNTHAHTPMTLMRGYGENMRLQDWLFTRIFPYEDRWNNDRIYWATLLGLAESARAGITSTTDMYYYMDPMSRAYLDSGSKGNLGRSIGGTASADLWNLPQGKDLLEGLEYHKAGNGRILADLAVHAEYTIRTDVAELVANEAAKRGLRMQVHISETAQEHENCLEERSMTPTEYFAKLGLFDVPASLAHCVWCSHDDIRLLKQKGCFVCSCPVSNAKLASGMMDAKYMKKTGVPISIGTDSVTSNNSLNFFEEMKFFTLIQKLNANDPTFISPKELLYMATRQGALSQGREDTGLIREGFAADLVVLDITMPNMNPVHDLLSTLVYSADSANIRMTVVDGTVLYDHGDYPTMDIEKIVSEAARCNNEMLAEVEAVKKNKK